LEEQLFDDAKVGNQTRLLELGVAEWILVFVQSLGDK
jgi:hypothetical protein